MTQQLSKADIDAAVAEARRVLAGGWGWFVVLGLVLIAAGGAAIAFPWLSTVAAKIALGWIFLLGGVTLIIHASSIPHWQGLVLSLLVGALYLVAGGYLAFLPLSGILTLTILLAALFIAEGVLEVLLAFRVRSHEGWGWLLLSGLVAIAVGGLIAFELPSSATWAIGLLAGVNLISTGLGFVFLGLTGRRLRQRATAA
jgi:uncharacterized membrane protein HdeD (DUF308 family)